MRSRTAISPRSKLSKAHLRPVWQMPIAPLRWRPIWSKRMSTGRCSIEAAAVRGGRSCSAPCDRAGARAATHSHLGMVVAELGRFDEAIACHQRAIELQPSDALLHYTLGRTLLQAQEPEESEASFRRALSLDRDLAPACHWLGNALLVRGRLEKGLSCYRCAIAIEPDLVEACEACAYSGERVSDHLGELLADPATACLFPPSTFVGARGDRLGRLQAASRRFARCGMRLERIAHIVKINHILAIDAPGENDGSIQTKFVDGRPTTWGR
jgi:tetratricopeptide (TPR) repeat protein